MLAMASRKPASGPGVPLPRFHILHLTAGNVRMPAWMVAMEFELRDDDMRIAALLGHPSPKLLDLRLESSQNTKVCLGSLNMINAPMPVSSQLHAERARERERRFGHSRLARDDLPSPRLHYRLR